MDSSCMFQGSYITFPPNPHTLHLEMQPDVMISMVTESCLFLPFI